MKENVVTCKSQLFHVLKKKTTKQQTTFGLPKQHRRGVRTLAAAKFCKSVYNPSFE